MYSRSANLTLALAAVLFWTAADASAQTTLTTGSTQTVTAHFGVGSYTALGQSFRVGSDNILDQFSFWMGGSGVRGGNLSFRTSLYAWDATTRTISGPELFGRTSSVYYGAYDPLRQVRYSTGGISLTSGATYMAFMRLIPPTGGQGGLIGWRTSRLGSADAGEQVTCQYGAITGGYFACGPNNGSFQAVFSSPTPVVGVPEPGAWSMILAGLTGLLAMVWSRRHSVFGTADA